MIKIYLQKFLEVRFLVKKFMRIILFYLFTILTPKKNSCTSYSKGKYINLDDFNQNASVEEMVGLLKGITIVAKKLGISVDVGKGYRALSNIGEDGGQVFHIYTSTYLAEKT